MIPQAGGKKGRVLPWRIRDFCLKAMPNKNMQEIEVR
jgi:hypothetical protein